MLAWDVETGGLSPRTSLITVATTYSPEKQTIYQFATLDPQGRIVKVDDFDAKKEAFMRELDEAPVLAGFNTPGFDIPFITVAFEIPPERVMNWIKKTFDLFEICKRACGGRTFGLNLVLDLNGFETKSGDGLAAVRQAERGEWEELGLYCLDDSRLTHAISTLTRIALPESYSWRKAHGGRTHDPTDMLFMLIGPDHRIDFERGTLEEQSVVAN
ncbi:hypothetical protein T484DRAFT_1757904 [Baffinella frigidus]|jgi:hypothetical protein|nr:hypothetical protein T484DRAFT_1757904 [Cryptophyta sp. CCMP2293]